MKYMIFIKTLLLCIFTYYTTLRIINYKEFKLRGYIKSLCLILIDSFIYTILREHNNFFYSIIMFIFLLSLSIYIKTKKDYIFLLIIIIISLAINEVLYFYSSAMAFIICSDLFKITNNNSIILIILFIYTVHIFIIWHNKRIKNGFSFLFNNINAKIFELLIIDVSAIILLLIIIISKDGVEEIGNQLIAFIVLSIFLFLTIKESINLYYRQKLLIQDLNETKKELEDKNKEIKILEEENLNFSKKSHSLAHKQKVLEHKINKLLRKKEYAEEFDFKEQVEEISKELYEDVTCGYISKTGISNIDDMLETMKEECIKNNIEFNVQIYGNMFKMINSYVEKEDLEILLADHIKDAIIAINHTDNINRTILVKLGMINGFYSIYFYDSGVEFDKSVLENLGKKPVTTHIDEGGTGMGFMNTFDTLRIYDASIEIEHLGITSKDNFTKIIKIKFDKNANFCLTK